MPVTEADVRAAMANEGYGGVAAGLLEEVWKRSLSTYGWGFGGHYIGLGEPLPPYDPADIAFPGSHSDVLVWGAISRWAFREKEYAAAAYAEGIHRARLADAVRAYAFEEVY